MEEAVQTGIDGVIVSDPGIFQIIRRLSPICPFISVPNQHRQLQDGGILAQAWRKEDCWPGNCLEEIREISEKMPDAELRGFIHGAMCISYSAGAFKHTWPAEMPTRDCAHPCRWRYHLVEEKRPGQYYPIEEEFEPLFQFKRPCSLPHLPELIQSGVTSLKIEGRVKSSFYVATVVKAYREAIDAFYEGRFQDVEQWMEEVRKVSNRSFTTGFFFGKPGPEAHNYNTSSYIRNYDFIGLVTGYDGEAGRLIVEQRNHFRSGETIEILPPEGSFHTVNP